MNISLENWLRDKLNETERMADYEVATDTVRCWIDEYNDFKVSELTIGIEVDTIKSQVTTTGVWTPKTN
jgi:hypothetical protein